MCKGSWDHLDRMVSLDQEVNLFVSLSYTMIFVVEKTLHNFVYLGPYGIITIVRHSQTANIPDCPRGFSALYSGYSFVFAHGFGLAQGHIQ